MKKELDDQLCRDFPLLYADRHGSKRTTAMYQGFSCGDGWFQIIYDVSAKIEPILAALPELSRPRALQVKEKHGVLNLYITMRHPEIDELIFAAQARSAVTCEECGAPGTLRQGGWWQTLCDTHEVERQARMAEREAKYKAKS